MQVITSFGSNQGNKFRILKAAAAALSDAVGRITGISAFYETTPWGFDREENFLNQVIVFESQLSPTGFLQQCLKTEEKFGRIRYTPGPRYASRPIDIDMLFYDSLILNLPDLQLPHPRICERNFVLAPLAEIMPDFIHPVSGKTIAQLFRESPDSLQVKKLNLNPG